MLSVAICDDDIRITGELDTLVQNIAKQSFIKVEIDVFWDGEDLVTAVNEQHQFDIIFLDIEMKKKNGILAARQIRKYDKNVKIVYITSHENYMQESFSVRPFRFIVKPVDEREFTKCFKSAYAEICNENFYFRYSYRRMHYKIPIRDILYFESNRRRVFIKTEKEVYVVYKKLNDIEDSLQECKVSFLRVHQSFLVNYNHVIGQSYDSIVMDNEKIIPISEERRRTISEQYCSMENTFYVDE